MAITDHPVLAQLAISHSPVIDAQRASVGTRLTLARWRPELTPGGAEVLAALAEVWPDAAARKPGAAFTPGTVVLNVVGEGLLHALLAAPARAPFALEVPAFLLADATTHAPLRAWHEAGGELWIKGRGATEIDAAWRGCFKHLFYELPDAPPPGRGSWSAVAAGAHSIAELDAAVRQGAVAVAGWPLAQPAPAPGARQKVAPEMQVVLELINRVDREEPIERLDATLKGDPSLAFRLLRCMNSPAFGLQVEISSFRHALMMLGYAKLKRWLALLLASGSRDGNFKPVIYAAVRRGLVMEELGRDSGCDDDKRSELFICGVFSLLDRLMQQPFDELLKSIPTSAAVSAALVHRNGPLLPYLTLVQAVEAASIYDIRAAADALLMAVPAVNRAVLRALVSARQLD